MILLNSLFNTEAVKGTRDCELEDLGSIPGSAANGSCGPGTCHFSSLFNVSSIKQGSRGLVELNGKVSSGFIAHYNL